MNYKNSLRRMYLACLAFVCMQASAYDFVADGIAYNILSEDNYEVEVTHNKDRYGTNLYSGDIVIPSEVTNDGNEYIVVAIGNSAFELCRELLSVSVPNSVTKIGERAFFQDDNIKTIILPSTITSIGLQAFYNCESLETINLSDQISSIGNSAFWGCSSLQSINIPNSLRSIGDYMFLSCQKLVSLVVPERVTDIGKSAFSGCTGLYELKLPNSLFSIGENAFEGCKSLNNIILPKNLKRIGKHAFYNCPAYVVESKILEPFETYAFATWSGSHEGRVLYVPLGTKEKYANCTGWQEVYYFKEIIEKAETFTISIKAVGNGTLSYDNTVARNETTNFTINEGTSVTITLTPDDGYRVKILTVNDTDVTSSITDNQYTISDINADTNVEAEFEAINESPIISFVDANVKAICVSNWDKNGDGELSEDEAAAVTNLGAVFYENTTITSFEEFQFFVGIEDLSSAFKKCTNLNKIIIPNSVKIIGKWAFYECSALTGAMIIPNSVTSIGDNAFEECSGLTGSLTLSSSLTSIGERAFLGCSGFSGSLIIPNSVTSIGKFAFYGCSGFTGPLTIPNSVTSIGGWAFDGCSGLTGTLTIPNSVALIGNSAFAECSNINKVISQIESPIKIDDDVFRGISSDAVLQVPKGTKAQYLEYTGWTKYFKDIIEEGDNITTYSLSISATGNGAVTYGDASVKGETSTFTVNKGTSVTITLTPDEGYRIKSLTVNNTDITSGIVNNQYTISSISAETNVEAEFEAITYTLSIKATGNGTVSYGDNSVKGKTSTFSVNEGTSVTITLTPDNGYRVKSLTVNNSDVTSSISDNQYTISSINADTSIEVEFEAIPPTTYTLSIKATGNGTISYGDNSVKGKTSTFSVNEGTSVTITLAPDDGYRVKSLKVNNTDVTSSISDNQYTISNISASTSIEAEFEAIPPTTYTLSIKATGNGSVSYGETSVKGKTSTFTVNEGTSVTITLTPDDGYRVKSLTVNNTDVTSSITDNQYTISSISADTYVAAEFEVIPPTTYTLSIKATGNGTVSYGNTSVKGKTSTFTVNEGTSVTITLTPDDGYRVKSLTVNNTDVTSSITDNQYTISSISANTNVAAEFEAIPPTTYTLSIKATGNGTVSYGNTSVKGKTSTFPVNEGTSVTITLTPDNGYRVKSLTVNNTDVKASISNNQYTISNINANTSVVAEFEAIPPTTYTLSIKATGNGSVSYGDASVKGKTSTFTVNEGTSVTITLTPDDGYRVKSLIVNNSVVTSSISNNQYTISSINANTSIVAEFEVIPPTTYTLSIKASGNGSVRYGDTSVRIGTKTFTVIEGTSADLIIIPDEAHLLKSFVLNNTDVTSKIVDKKYTISNVNNDITVEVEFKAIETLTYDGMEFKVSSTEQKEVVVAKGEYGLWIEVPETVSAYNLTWTVTGFEDGAFESATELAAVTWNPQIKFKEKVTNPNLLLYVRSANYAPTEVNNVIVNGKARSITLNDAESDNNFYCPQEFTAENITYEHNYSMKTGYSTCQGWETIVLPFDVAVVTNNIGTELVPYPLWTLGESKRPFWLCSMNEDGWKDESAIKANTPYIISMPNNDNYDATYNISGNIVFSASNVTVHTSDNLVSSKHGHRNLVPNFQNTDSSSNIYALNVNNLWSTNTDSDLAEGSAFIRDSRQVRPFEAYMTIDSGGGTTRSISIFDDDDTTGIMNLPLACKNKDGVLRVYSLSGMLLKQGNDEKILNDLPKGVYVVNGKKIVK